MKKIFALTLLMTVILCGCGNQSSDTDTKDSGAEDSKNGTQTTEEKQDTSEKTEDSRLVYGTLVIMEDYAANLKSDGTVELIPLKDKTISDTEKETVDSWNHIISISQGDSLAAVNQEGKLSFADEEAYCNSGNENDRAYRKNLLAAAADLSIAKWISADANECYVLTADKELYCSESGNSGAVFTCKDSGVNQVTGCYYLKNGSILALTEEGTSRIENLKADEWDNVSQIAYNPNSGDVTAVLTNGTVKSTHVFYGIEEWTDIVSIGTAQDVVAGVTKQGTILVSSESMPEWSTVVSDITDAAEIAFSVNADVLAVKNTSGDVELFYYPQN